MSLNEEEPKDRFARYRAKNRERRNAASAQWWAEHGAAYREANREKLRAIAAKHRAANRDKIRARLARWQAENPERQREFEIAYRARHPERRKASVDAHRVKPEAKEKARSARKIWSANNKDRLAARSAARRALKLQATPRWVAEEEFLFVYAEAQRKSIETGTDHHVDHIVPLKSKIVCGLHVPWNLQVLIGSENLSKNNRHWPDMP